MHDNQFMVKEDNAMTRQTGDTTGIYLDYNSSAPLDPRVAEVMAESFGSGIGNSSSAHRFGRCQAATVEKARAQVAESVGARPSGVVFTAGATEANNLALRGAVEGSLSHRRKILISAVEHASVRQTARWLDEQGLAKIEILPVTSGGFIDLNAAKEIINTDVLLVSVMAANSETGVLNPLAEVSEIAHSAGALFHCDATQIVGRLPFSIGLAGVDLASISSHKICGPGGVGALVGTQRGLRQLSPIIHGGEQEGGVRSGSLNVAGISGFGTAAQLSSEEMGTESKRVVHLRDQLVSALKADLYGVQEIGDISKRLPNTACIHFADADAEAVIANSDPVAISAGSACSSGSIEPSEVLLAMGLSRAEAFEAVRFSLGRFTSEHEVERAVPIVAAGVEYVRDMTESNAR